IEVLVLQALAHRVQGDAIRARAPLERALTLAEAEGYVRIFLDEEATLRPLLGHVAAPGPASAYARRLLSAFETPARLAPTPLQAGPAAPVQPLTRRGDESLR